MYSMLGIDPSTAPKPLLFRAGKKARSELALSEVEGVNPERSTEFVSKPDSPFFNRREPKG